MAEEREEQSREDLTEEASPHRIEEYRRKGMVAQSRELSALAVLLATGVATYCMSPSIGSQLAEFMRIVFQTDFSSHFELGSSHLLNSYLIRALKLAIFTGAPVCIAGFLFGLLSSVIQVGAIFSMEPLIPDFDKLNPIQGFQRMFSVKHVLDGVRLIIKMAATLGVAYLLLKSEILLSPVHVGGEAGYTLANLERTTKGVFIALSIVFGLFAAMDYGFQKLDYSKRLRMTKQEAKQEHKEREGDPQIRARIRAAQREMARRRMMQAVKKANVVITNPTHIAVALVYDGSGMSAPKVVAKGADLIAQKIKQVASDAGVPLVENVPLARTLYKTVKVGQVIPRNLYQAVAEVLAYVYRLKRKSEWSH